MDLLYVKQRVSGYDQTLASFTYNNLHEPLTATDASGQQTIFQYNTYGDLTGYGPPGEYWSFTIDGPSGWLWNVFELEVYPNEPLNERITQFAPALDGSLRVRYVQDGATSYTVNYEYDNMDRITKITYPGNLYEQTIYDKLDAVLSRDTLGRWSSAEYDPLRRLVATKDALGRTTQFDWCSCGSLASVTDALGQTTSWVRDLQGRVTSKIFPDGSKVAYEYESKMLSDGTKTAVSSRLRSITDAKGQKTQYDYYIDNNLKTVSYNGSSVPTPPSPCHHPLARAGLQMWTGLSQTTRSVTRTTNSAD
jgi:YD repeat-containing protein